ncbi:MAG: hypothetical protein ACE5J3_00210 [Methanosarcinales archaeon]
MSRTTELLSKTKYSNIEELLYAAKKLDPDNDWLQICIEDYYKRGKDFDLEVIIHALEYYESL